MHINHTHRHPHTQEEGINQPDFLGWLHWPKTPHLQAEGRRLEDQIDYSQPSTPASALCLSYPSSHLLTYSRLSCRSGRACLLPYQPWSPTSIPSKGAPYLSSFTVGKWTPASVSALIPDQQRERSAGPLTWIPPPDFCSTLSLINSLFISFLPGPLPQLSKCLPVPGSSLPFVLV